MNDFQKEKLERQAQQRKQIERRYRSLRWAILFAMGTLLARVIQVQTVESSTYKNQEIAEVEDQMFIRAPRGKIFDASGHVLAGDQITYSIVYIPSVSGRVEGLRMAQMLAPVLQIQREKIIQAMDLGKNPKLPITMPRRIFLRATLQQVAFVQEHQSELPGILVVPEIVRTYPQSFHASHLLGFLNSIPPDRLSYFRGKGYPLDDVVGVYGLERQYESNLHGKNDRIRVTGTKNSHVQVVSSVPGYDLRLHVDFRLQVHMEEALAQQIRVINANPKLKKVQNAAAVAMNPQTGAILGIASYPAFNPQHWVGGISQQNYNAFVPAQQNWATQVAIPPGSTIKPLTVLLGLQKGIITPYTTVYDPGRLKVGWKPNGDPHYLYCWDHAGHGYVNARKALAESCNVYMYQLSLWIGKYPAPHINRWLKTDLPAAIHDFQSLHQQFGLGNYTGIDVPEEVRGGLHSNGILADLPYTAIGQSESYTALQLAQYVSTIANGGKRMQPQVVSDVLDAKGKVIQHIDPKVLNRVFINPTHLRVIQEGMRDVVQKPYGTAYGTFRGAPYRAAGKTGTAETGVGEDNSLFVGYAPVDHPQVAIAVIVPGGGHGSDSSGPIARKIFDAYFKAAAP